MRRLDLSLVGSLEPALHERGNLVDRREQLVGLVSRSGDDQRLVHVVRRVASHQVV
jgi:hypothetical protein